MSVLAVRRIQSGSMLNLSYVVSSGDKAAVVDPSFAGVKIWRTLSSESLKLEYILNTHGHADHVSSNEFLKEKLGAPIAIHSLDAGMIGDQADLLLEGGERLPLGDSEIRVIHTPGHTPGSVCFLIDDCLFTGDTLFVGGWGRTDLEGGSDSDLFRSLQKLRSLDDETRVYPGHSYGGYESTIRTEKLTNPALVARTLDEFRSLI